jgi:hypothetical protein
LKIHQPVVDFQGSLLVVYPGNIRYELDRHVEVVPIADIARGGLPRW